MNIGGGYPSRPGLKPGAPATTGIAILLLLAALLLPALARAQDTWEILDNEEDEASSEFDAAVLNAASGRTDTGLRFSRWVTACNEPVLGLTDGSYQIFEPRANANHSLRQLLIYTQAGVGIYFRSDYTSAYAWSPDGYADHKH